MGEQSTVLSFTQRTKSQIPSIQVERTLTKEVAADERHFSSQLFSMPKQTLTLRHSPHYHSRRRALLGAKRYFCSGQRLVLAIGLSAFSVGISRKCSSYFWMKKNCPSLFYNQDQRKRFFFARAAPLNSDKSSHFKSGGTTNLSHQRRKTRHLSQRILSGSSDGVTSKAKLETNLVTGEQKEQSSEQKNRDPGMNEPNCHTDVIGGGAINEKYRSGLGFHDALAAATEASPTTEHFQGQRAIPNKNNTPAAISTQFFDPRHNVSHLLHSIVGLDRYPNYLSRWTQDGSERAIDELEQALEDQLSKVRQQRRESQKRHSEIQLLVKDVVESLNLYDDEEEKRLTNLEDSDALPFPLRPPRDWDEAKKKVLHPDAVEHIFQSRCFKKNTTNYSYQQISGQHAMEKSKSDPFEIGEVLKGKANVELDAGQLQLWMDEELFDVYSFPLLSPDFCSLLKKIVRAIADASTKELRYQSLKLGNRPVNLDLIGMGWLNDLLFYLIIKPMTRHLYQTQECGNEDLDWRHGYIAGYSAKAAAETATPRNRLVPHTDDSEVTLNICVGDEFEGGALHFSGLRGTKDEGIVRNEEESRFHPRLGTALLHAGRHLHEVTPVTRGDRYALIVWARSWKGIRAQTCPCCWLNRRSDNVCVCGPAWN